MSPFCHSNHHDSYFIILNQRSKIGLFVYRNDTLDTLFCFKSEPSIGIVEQFIDYTSTIYTMENHNKGIYPKKTERFTMERKKYIFGALTMILFLAMSSAIHSQHRYTQAVYDAYINGQMEKWDQVIGDMEAEELTTVDDKLELIEYYYGQTGYLIGNDQKAQAKSTITKAKRLINEVIKAEPSNATALAFKGVFLAYDMSINKLKAPIIGPLSMKYIKMAYETDNNNIQALSDMGNMLYYAPGIFGGDKRKGIAYIERAIQSIEEQKLTYHNWHYLNLMITLARFRKEMGENDAATDIYKKLLELEPNFMWVRKELYPITSTNH